jgi:hypothetical protein
MEVASMENVNVWLIILEKIVVSKLVRIIVQEKEVAWMILRLVSAMKGIQVMIALRIVVLKIVII